MESERHFGFTCVKIATWVILFLMVSPVFVVIPFSLNPTNYLTWPHGELSLRWFVKFFTSADWQSSVFQSFYISVCSTIVAVCLGTLCAVGLWRISSRFSQIVRNLTLLPLIAPPVVSGMIFFYAFSEFGLLDRGIGLIVAYTLLSVPYVVITVSTSLANFDPRLEQAARNLGASIGQTFLKVIIPGILPGIAAGAAFSFIVAWDEVVVALFVTSFDIVTLPKRMWETLRYQTDATTAACATTLLFLTVVGVGIYMIFLGRAQPRTGGQRQLAENR
jgi:putative spermidine/putrescine transport system permease protein